MYNYIIIYNKSIKFLTLHPRKVLTNSFPLIYIYIIIIIIIYIQLFCCFFLIVLFFCIPVDYILHIFTNNNIYYTFIVLDKSSQNHSTLLKTYVFGNRKNVD